LTRYVYSDGPRDWLSAAFLSALVGCGGADDGGDLPPVGPGMPVDVFEDTRATALEFEGGGELTLVAGQTQRIVVRAEPAGRHTVRFALLGKAQDAFLSRDLVETGENGVASTELTVLGAAADFVVRAAAGRVENSLHVITLEANEAILSVTANYEGRRTPAQWTASVHPGQTCAQVEGIPFRDGPVSASSRYRTVELEHVPADVALAVVIRGEQVAGGCRGVDPLLANTDARIEIEVLDRPMEIAGLSLDMAFGVEAAEQLNPAFVELAFRAALTFTGAGTDLEAVLDAMSERANDRVAFDEARASQDWVSLLASGLPSEPGNGLRTKAQSLMQRGLWRLYDERAFVGSLTAPGAGMGELELSTVMGLPPAAVGFEAENVATVAAEPEDYLRIGTTLHWRPSPLLAAAGDFAAREENLAFDSAADAIAEEFDCEQVAVLLADAGAIPGMAYPGCGEACTQTLCESAIDDLWARVEGSDLPSVPWQFSGAARAEVDESARPGRIEGTWAGSLTVAEFPPDIPAPVPIQGPFSGAE
jgi:hypothetical protein